MLSGHGIVGVLPRHSTTLARPVTQLLLVLQRITLDWIPSPATTRKSPVTSRRYHPPPTTHQLLRYRTIPSSLPRHPACPSATHSDPPSHPRVPSALPPAPASSVSRGGAHPRPAPGHPPPHHHPAAEIRRAQGLGKGATPLHVRRHEEGLFPVGRIAP